MPEIANKEKIIADAFVPELKSADDNKVYMLANGDLRDTANMAGWETQKRTEAKIAKLFESYGYQVERVHAYDSALQHGFINSQKMGNAVFSTVPKNAIVVIVESIWEYSHHILGALTQRKDLKILTIANYSGEWPGLVGLSNLNACLVKHKREFSTAWSEDFTDPPFIERIESFLKSGKIEYSKDHIQSYNALKPKLENEYADALEIGEAYAKKLMRESDFRLL
jgi:hypothetical protein